MTHPLVKQFKELTPTSTSMYTAMIEHAQVSPPNTRNAILTTVQLMIAQQRLAVCLAHHLLFQDRIFPTQRYTKMLEIDQELKSAAQKIPTPLLDQLLKGGE